MKNGYIMLRWVLNWHESKQKWKEWGLFELSWWITLKWIIITFVYWLIIDSNNQHYKVLHHGFASVLPPIKKDFLSTSFHILNFNWIYSAIYVIVFPSISIDLLNFDTTWFHLTWYSTSMPLSISIDMLNRSTISSSFCFSLYFHSLSLPLQRVFLISLYLLVQFSSQEER